MDQRFAISLAVLLLFFQVGSSLKCYHCISNNDGNCADPFNDKNIQSIDCTHRDAEVYQRLMLYNILPATVLSDIPGASKSCHKITIENGAVIRTCLDSNPTNINHTCNIMLTMSGDSTPEKKIKSCSVCDKDNCNGAELV